MPKHNPEVVASNIVHQHLVESLLSWQSTTKACELVFIATCQRVVWIFWGGDGSVLPLLGEADCFHGTSAWRYLLEVAAGLNSTNIGDREIIGQMRKALHLAKEVGTAGVEAQSAMDDILREANRLRSRIGLCDGSASVATSVIKYLESNLSIGSKVALVGSGPMSSYLAIKLPKAGLSVTVSNRTLDKVKDCGLDIVPLKQLIADPQGFDVIISATSSDVPLFTLDKWSKLDRSPVQLIDLALPYDFEPELDTIPWVTRIDLLFFMTKSTLTENKRVVIASGAEPFVISALKRLHKRACLRSININSRTAQEKLADAWEAMEAEAIAPGSVLANLKPTELAALNLLLKRGRTLAFKSFDLQNRSVLEQF
jgi:glutamyl-tRNA reductase